MGVGDRVVDDNEISQSKYAKAIEPLDFQLYGERSGEGGNRHNCQLS